VYAHKSFQFSYWPALDSIYLAKPITITLFQLYLSFSLWRRTHSWSCCIPHSAFSLLAFSQAFTFSFQLCERNSALLFTADFDVDLDILTKSAAFTQSAPPRAALNDFHHATVFGKYPIRPNSAVQMGLKLACRSDLSPFASATPNNTSLSAEPGRRTTHHRGDLLVGRSLMFKRADVSLLSASRQTDRTNRNISLVLGRCLKTGILDESKESCPKLVEASPLLSAEAPAEWTGADGHFGARQ
jgi:hypothetical protein